MAQKLEFMYDSEVNDFIGNLPEDREGNWDVYLLFAFFLGYRPRQTNKNLISELDERGYDLSTISFSISQKNNSAKTTAFPFLAHTPKFEDFVSEFNNLHFELTKANKDCYTWTSKLNTTVKLSFVKNQIIDKYYLIPSKYELSEEVILTVYRFLKYLNKDTINY